MVFCIVCLFLLVIPSGNWGNQLPILPAIVPPGVATGSITAPPAPITNDLKGTPFLSNSITPPPGAGNGISFQLPKELGEFSVSDQIKDKCKSCLFLNLQGKCKSDAEIQSSSECAACKLDDKTGVSCKPSLSTLNQQKFADPQALERLLKKFDGDFQFITQEQLLETLKRLRKLVQFRALENCIELAAKDLQQLKAPFFQGDLMLTLPQLDQLLSGAGDLGDDQGLPSDLGSTPKGFPRMKRKILSNENSYWKKRNIQYYIDSSLAAAKAAIKEALQAFENHTCFTFEEMSQPSASDVNFISGEGCYSILGVHPTKKPQGISLQYPDCIQFGVITHEIGHLLALEHEHSRPDRDKYYLVLQENIEDKYINQYDRCSDNGGDCRADVPFDYGSNMCYDGTAFVNEEAQKRGLLAAYPKIPDNSLYLSTLGQTARGPTFYDFKEINGIYCQEPKSCNGGLKCENGGYPNPKNCGECECPDGFVGKTCSDIAQGFPAECGGKLQATADWQEIISPNHPKTIDPLQECTWLLTAPSGQVIAFEFMGPDFGFPSSTASGILHCDPNYVEIRYRADQQTTGPKFCGTELPTRKLTSQGGQAMVLMRAPVSKLEREKHTVPTKAVGFKLRFKAIAPPSDLEVEEPFVAVNSKNAAKFIKETLSRCCADKHKLCCYWATLGDCNSDAEYMRINCQRACGTCGCTNASECRPTVDKACLNTTNETQKRMLVASNVTTSGCADLEVQQCPLWAKNGECEKNAYWMKPNCQKSCQCCGCTITSITGGLAKQTDGGTETTTVKTGYAVPPKPGK